MSDRTKRGADEPPHEEFLTLFRRGLKFTEELLAENEKLRFRVASLEAENNSIQRHGGGPEGEALVQALKRQISELEGERAKLLHRYAEVETLNRDYQARYAEIEEEHNNLANLYIASYQLHSTMNFIDVVQAVSEIVINLVGVSRFTMFIHDAPSQTLYPIFTEGQGAEVLPVRLGEGVIGKAVKARTRHVAEGGAATPLAVIPLATVETIVGAIVIDKLLVQKAGFSAVDHELFTLLGAHAATALFAGLIRSRVGDAEMEQALTIAHARKLLSL